MSKMADGVTLTYTYDGMVFTWDTATRVVRVSSQVREETQHTFRVPQAMVLQESAEVIIAEFKDCCVVWARQQQRKEGS